MPSSAAFLRQISGKEGWKSASMKWDKESYEFDLKQMDGFSSQQVNGFVMRKRVMVVVDQTSHSKHAMMWALTHVANKGDMLTLLHIIPSDSSSDDCSPYLATSLGSLCKACKPEVEVEALVIQGPKLGTVMSQVKKLEVSVLVLGQKKPSSLLLNWIRCLSRQKSSRHL